ncbi:MAG TPA: F0F1 ATP synthase subunit B [Casimicrobiaceae bacterium]|nr:F0F1 ATP synthase subunit B [Casimicrobiaceae bacterium]
MNINLTLLMQAAAFAAFIWFTARFIWPPLMRAVDTRQKQIADGLAAGEQGRKELASAEKRIADMLTDAKSKAAEIVANGEKFKSETMDAAKTEAKAEADRMIAAAKAEIQQEVMRAKEQLRNQVADLAVAGAAKILQREVDAKAHADLLASIRTQL